MENNSKNDFFRIYGISIILIIAIFGILIYSIKLSRNSWKNNLKTSIETVLEEKYGSQYQVLDYLEINSPITSNMAAYNLKDKLSNKEGQVVIVRIATFYGPLSGVYTIFDNDNSNKKDIQFVNFCSFHGRISKQSITTNLDKRIEYWQAKIPDILFN